MRSGVVQEGDNGAFRYSQNTKKKGGPAWFSTQLFLQRPHLVEFTAKQEVEVSSAHWYGRGGKARIMVVEMIEGEKKRETVV